MRNFFVALFLIFASACITAQEHLSFKGVPIEGSMSDFTKKLTSKGLKFIGREGNITAFTGDFTGRKATIGVTATDDGENVFGVVVIFESAKEWKTLVNTYDYYKDLYTRKYGKPTVSQEYNPARTDYNTSLMLELHNGTVEYSSVWEVTGGEIKLSITNADTIGEGMVTILYRDSQNVDVKVQNDLNDI